jgi:hypothetical protein
VRALLTQDQPGTCRPVGQVHQVGGFGDPGALADVAGGVDRRVPGIGGGEYLGGIAQRGIDGAPQGESHVRSAAGRGKTIRGPGRIRADQHLGRIGVSRCGPVGRRERGQRLIEHAEMVGGGVTVGVPRGQQSGQRLPGGDVGAVQKHQQRMKPERLLPGRRCVSLLSDWSIGKFRASDLTSTSIVRVVCALVQQRGRRWRLQFNTGLR